MKINIQRPISRKWGMVLLILGSIFMIGGCAGRVPLDEEFELQVGQARRLADTELFVKLESVGHWWDADGRHYPLVDLTVTNDGENQSIQLDDTVRVGIYQIILLGINPETDTCTLVVHQAP